MPVQVPKLSGVGVVLLSNIVPARGLCDMLFDVAIL